VAGPLERNRSVCLPEPRPLDPFFPLAGPIFAAKKQHTIGTELKNKMHTQL